MRNWITIGLLALGTSAFHAVASDQEGVADGVDVLAAFTNSSKAGADEPLLGMVGFYGEPQPPQWLILTSIPSKPGVLRESVFSKGKVVAERQFRRLPSQDLPDIPILKPSIEVTSRSAFEIGERQAREEKVSFDTVHFQLRCRDLNQEPVWMLSLINRAQVSVGAVYISAQTGKVLRTVWPEPTPQKYSSSPPEVPSSPASGNVAARTGSR